MSTEDDMWRDYDHYMHTGELSEYFEEEYCEEEYVRDSSGDGITDDYCEQLDDVIRYLKQLKKENERIIKAEKKKARKKAMAQKESGAKQKSSAHEETATQGKTIKTSAKSDNQEPAPKMKIIDDPVFYIIMFLLMVLILMAIFI